MVRKTSSFSSGSRSGMLNLEVLRLGGAVGPGCADDLYLCGRRLEGWTRDRGR